MGMIPEQRINMSPTSNESIYFQETFKFVKTRRDVILNLIPKPRKHLLT